MARTTIGDGAAVVPAPTDVARLLVHSNVFISLSATSWAVTTALLVGLPVEWPPLFIVFAASLFVYSLNRVTDLAEDERNVPDRAAFTRRFGYLLLGLGVLAYLAAVALAVVRSVPGAPYLVLPLVVAAAYTLGLKDVLLVKNLVVGLAWGAIPLGMGVYYDALWTVELWLLFAYVTAMLTIAAAIFDVKDIEGDRAEGIATLPSRYGPATTRRVCLAATLLVALGVVALVATGVLPVPYLSLLALNAYVAGYVPFADRNRGPLFYGFVVDGEHLLLAAVVAVVTAAG